jgi:hypothetical protein
VRRNEREHAREKQRLTKDKDTGTFIDLLDGENLLFDDAMVNGSLAKASLTKANQAKTKLENIARELQKAGNYSTPRSTL